MRKSTIIWIFVALMGSACGSRQTAPAPIGDMTISMQQNEKGDSTLYGLACDGCTDSVLVLLPYNGYDLDTLDIITARQEHHIYGRPHIGDELAVTVNPEDSAEALKVINLTTLCQNWCYQVMPTFRNVDQMPQRMQRRMMERIPDSIRQKLLVPLEYSLRLKKGFTAQARGARRMMTTTDDMSPVEYPQMKRYTEWRIFNGQLVLTATTATVAADKDSLVQQKDERDTVDIVLLNSDTLVLRFKDHELGLYNKQ